jgi:hypothetical protein
MAKPRTIPKNIPGKRSTSKNNSERKDNEGAKRELKLLRNAEIIATEARVMARFDADVLLKAISALFNAPAQRSDRNGPNIVTS